jgi:hypothetical protein
MTTIYSGTGYLELRYPDQKTSACARRLSKLLEVECSQERLLRKVDNIGNSKYIPCLHHGKYTLAISITIRRQ